MKPKLRPKVIFNWLQIGLNRNCFSVITQITVTVTVL